MGKEELFKELTIQTKKLLDIKAFCINSKEIHKGNEDIDYILNRILKIIEQDYE